MGRGEDEPKNSFAGDSRIPVTLLCGFLGSGKTTLLKFILENKHEDTNFKCAVIVNDMAELNIDKSLIDSTDLIQTDEAMVGMQNGCICCTLQTDLVEQVIGLVQKKKFTHILIEASGVSEPHEIAPLFELDEHEHEHNSEEAEAQCESSGKPQLGEVARIDTCVTMIDSADFYSNLSSMRTYDNCELVDLEGMDCQPIVGTIAELMMDQVEFANVIILNKKDLVNEGQQNDLEEKIKCLNPKAKIVKSIQAKIDLNEIINTGLYVSKDEFWVTSMQQEKANEEARKAGKRVPEACTARFDIKSFVYRARKPFHPGRLHDLVMEPFFMGSPEAIKDEVDEDEGDAEEEEDGDISEDECAMMEEQKEILYHEHQAQANEKQKHRIETMGELLRSKGFMWMATSNDVIGMWQQAGNVLRIEAENPWHCLVPEKWKGTLTEELVLQDFKKANGEEWEYKDRRQEIVFIGHKMKGDVIQKLLDECLLTEEEMALGPDKWKETMEHLDPIGLALEEVASKQVEEKENLEGNKSGAKKRKGDDVSGISPEKKAVK